MIIFFTPEDKKNEVTRLREALHPYIQDKSSLQIVSRNSKNSKGTITGEETAYVLNQLIIENLPFEKTTVVLHTTNDKEIEDFLKKTSGLTITATSKPVLDYYQKLVGNKHTFLDVLPIPIKEFTLGRGSEGETLQVVYSPSLGKTVDIKELTTVLENENFTVSAFSNDAKTSYEKKHVAICGSQTEAAEAIGCGLGVILLSESVENDIIIDGETGFSISTKKLGGDALISAILKKVPKASTLNQMKCMSSISNLVLHGGYEKTHGKTLALATKISLEKENATVTVGVQIEFGTEYKEIDKTINSLVSQTYKDFNTILLINGPNFFSEELSERYGLKTICTDDLPIENPLWLHDKAIKTSGKFYKPIENNDVLSPEFLKIAVAKLEETKGDVFVCKTAAKIKDKNGKYELLPSSVLLRIKPLLQAGGYNGRNPNDIWEALSEHKACFVVDTTKLLTQCFVPTPTHLFIRRGLVTKATTYLTMLMGLGTGIKSATAYNSPWLPHTSITANTKGDRTHTTHLTHSIAGADANTNVHTEIVAKLEHKYKFSHS